MITKRRGLGGKIESTYNTDAVPVVGTDDIAVEELSWALTGVRMNERPEARPSLGKLAKVYGGGLIIITGKIPLKGSGTAGTPPEFDPILRACGMAVTNVPSTSDTYKPTSDPSTHKSASFYIYEDGMRMIVTGCRGTFTLDGPAGDADRLSFTMTGHFSTPTDVALPTPTLDSTVAPLVLSAGFTVDSYAGVIAALAFDMGNNVVTPPDANGSDGYGEVRITGRQPTGSINPERVLAATKNFFTDFTGGSAMALSTGVLGSSAGNRVQISLAAISYTDIAPGDRDDIAIYELPYDANESSGDDEITLAFT